MKIKEKKDIDRTILLLVVAFAILLIIFQSINNITHIASIRSDKHRIHGTDEGTGFVAYADHGKASMCLNTAPIITNTCNLTNATLRITDNVTCTINATDLNHDNITYSIIFNTSPEIFTIFPNGTLNFTPVREAMEKNNTFQVHAQDDSGCSNNDSYKNFNVYLRGGNRAPVLIKPIPNQTIIKDHFYMLTMTDYFSDPESDAMFFFYIYQSGTTTSIRMLGDRAEIRGLSCGNTSLYYVAVDILGLSNISNTVTYEVLCPDQSLTPQSQNQNNQGSGGSGGGSKTRECSPLWKCNSWSSCQYGNYSYRRCLDYNGCSKEYEKFFFQNCTYVKEENSCSENWDCNAWSTCEAGFHTRMCLDMNTCGTENQKPLEKEKCSKVPSCFNGILDEGETGIDCGGACGVCRNIEQPKKEGISTVTLIAAAFVLTMSLTLAIIYRSKIEALFKRIFGKKPKAKPKVYINEKQKEKLVLLLNIAQTRLDENKLNYAIDELAIFQKEYFRQLLAMDTLNHDELIRNVTKLKDKKLEAILVMFYAKITNIVHLRSKGLEIKKQEIQELIDESSHKIFLIAEFTDKDAMTSIKDRIINANIQNMQLEKSYNMLSNLYIALKFGELIEAKNTYKELFKTYERLSNTDKSIIYNDTIRAFHAIEYLEDLYKE